MISTYVTNNWITITVMFLLLLLVILHQLYQVQFNKLVAIFNASDYFMEYKKRNVVFLSLFNGLLFIFQLGVYGVFLLLIKVRLFNLPYSYQLFFEIIKLLSIFIIGRYLIGKILSFIFEINRIQGVLSFVKFTYLSKVAIYIFPFLWFVLYNENLVLFWFSVGIIILLLVFFYIKIVLINQKIIFSHLFYFILYLCTLEITPLIYLYRKIFLV